MLACYTSPHTADFGNGVTIEVTCDKDARHESHPGHAARVLIAGEFGKYGATLTVRWPGAGVTYDQFEASMSGQSLSRRK